MRKNKILSITLGISLILGFASPYSVSAASYPSPNTTGFITPGNVFNGWFGDISVGLIINEVPGRVSSFGVDSTLIDGGFNPQALTSSQPLSLSWNIKDSSLTTSVTGCDITVDSLDSGNSYNKSLNGIGTSSAGMTFDTTGMVAGTYTFYLHCDLSNGKAVIDYSHIYFLPSGVSPAPAPTSFIKGGFASDGYSLLFQVSGQFSSNYGDNSSMAGVVTGKINPLAFSPVQQQNAKINMDVTYPPSWQFWRPYISSCTFSVYKIGGGKVYSSDITATPIFSQSLSLPMSLIPGNYITGVTCSFSNGHSMSDGLFMYIVPNAPSSPPLPPPPGCDVTKPLQIGFLANPSVITQGHPSTLSWSTDIGASCTGTGFDTGGKATGTQSVSPMSDTTYSVRCTKACAADNTKSLKITVLPPSSNPAPPAPSGPGCFPQIDIKVQ